MQQSCSSIQRSAELCPASPCGLSGSSGVQWTCHPNRNPLFSFTSMISWCLDFALFLVLSLLFEPFIGRGMPTVAFCQSRPPASLWVYLIPTFPTEHVIPNPPAGHHSPVPQNSSHNCNSLVWHMSFFCSVTSLHCFCELFFWHLTLFFITK